MKLDSDVSINSGPPVAMCFKEFSKVDNLPRFKSRAFGNGKNLNKPFESLFFAAGFNFSYGTLISECGYSDNFDNLFFGEEILQMHQMFKKGYKMYSPPKNVAYHLWERDYRPVFSTDHKQTKESSQASINRVFETINTD